MKTAMQAILLAALVLAVGCTNYTEPVVEGRNLTPAEKQFNAVWDASLDVLGESYFPIDRRDRREGIIQTEPIVGKSFFEFWRKDGATPAATAESSLHTIYRIATVRIRPVGDGGYEPRVEVRTYRSNRPDVDVEIDPVQPPGRTEPGVPAYLTPLGRDENLEARLAEDIRKRAADLLGRA